MQQLRHHFYLLKVVLPLKVQLVISVIQTNSSYTP